MWELKWLSAVVDIAFDESCSEKISNLRLNAVDQLHSRILHYKRALHLPEELLDALWDKKYSYIQKATTRNELTEIMKPSLPIYRFGTFYPSSPYHADEEELIYWAYVSPAVKLDSDAMQRYIDLFKKCLPEIAAKLNL